MKTAAQHVQRQEQSRAAAHEANAPEREQVWQPQREHASPLPTVRPEAPTQNRWQEIANNHSRVQQQAAVQRMANNSAQVRRGRVIQRMADEHAPMRSAPPIQRKAVIQAAFTRAQFTFQVDSAVLDGRLHPTFNELNPIDQQMVIEDLASMGYLVADGILTDQREAMQGAAEENSDVDHVGGFQEEIEPGTDAYTQLDPDADDGDGGAGGKDAQMGGGGGGGGQVAAFKLDVTQFARGPGPSGPKDVPADGSFMQNVTYVRDAVGNIDFSDPQPGYTLWNDPVISNPVDLNEDSTDPNYGKMLNNNYVKIAGASRSQHFSIGNRVARKHAQPENGGGRTWHHLVDRFQMVLVDTRVHSKYGHNGGFHFWQPF